MAVAVRDVLDRQVIAERVAKIETLDLSFVREKILTSEALPVDVVDTTIAEYRRFMSLIAMGYDHLGMTSAEVDEVWHTHILFTRDYAEFCGDVFGYFVHHVPNIPSRRVNETAPNNLFEAYRREFGEAPEIWQPRGGPSGAVVWMNQDPKNCSPNCRPNCAPKCSPSCSPTCTG